jgi:hypothetical protein
VHIFTKDVLEICIHIASHSRQKDLTCIKYVLSKNKFFVSFNYSTELWLLTHQFQYFWIFCRWSFQFWRIWKKVRTMENIISYYRITLLSDAGTNESHLKDFVDYLELYEWQEDVLFTRVELLKPIDTFKGMMYRIIIYNPHLYAFWS